MVFSMILFSSHCLQNLCGVTLWKDILLFTSVYELYFEENEKCVLL